MHPVREVKVCVLGPVAVGKTSLVMSFARGQLGPTVSTVAPQTHQVEMFDRAARDRWFVQLWDTAGQERYQALMNSYLRAAAGVVFVYDVTDPASLMQLRTTWIPFAFEHGELLRPETIVVAGNKSDLAQTGETQTTLEAIAYCAKHGYTHVLTTATVRERAAEPFQLCIDQLATATTKAQADKPGVFRLAQPPVPPPPEPPTGCC
jgi:small GTP-binding protein